MTGRWSLSNEWSPGDRVVLQVTGGVVSGDRQVVSGDRQVGHLSNEWLQVTGWSLRVTNGWSPAVWP